MWYGKAGCTRWIGLVTASLAVGGALGAPAARADDLGARALGSGNTGYANPNDPGASPENVAATSLIPQYTVVARGGIGPDARLYVGGAAVDSRTSAVSLGASYYRLTDDVPPTGSDLPGWKPSDAELHDATTHQGVGIGLAYPFLSRRMSVGAHLRYDWRDSEQVGTSTGFNFGFSIAASPGAHLTLAASTQNLLENGYHDTTRTLALGGRWDPGEYIGVEVDAVAPLTNEWSWKAMEYRAGVSVGVVKFLRLNAGYFDSAGTAFATGGIGLGSEKADLDYGVKVQLDDPNRNTHELDVRVKF